MLMVLTVIISKKCNLSCPFCLAEAKANIKEPELSKDEVIEALGKFEHLAAIKITGGEPLLPETLEKTYAIVDWATSRGIEVQINTNGTQEWPCDLGERNKLVQFQVSIDGTEEVHDSLRGKGVYQKATSFIKDIADRGFYVRAMSVITDYNKQETQDIISNMAKLNGTPVLFQFVNNSGRGGKVMKRNFQKIKKVTEKIIEELDNLGVECRPVREKCGSHIGAGGTKGALDPQGYIIPCPSLDTHRICHYTKYNEIGTAHKMKRLITDKGITCFLQEGIK